jgi:hypothetical protein
MGSYVAMYLEASNLISKAYRKCSLHLMKISHHVLVSAKCSLRGGEASCNTTPVWRNLQNPLQSFKIQRGVSKARAEILNKTTSQSVVWGQSCASPVRAAIFTPLFTVRVHNIGTKIRGLPSLICEIRARPITRQVLAVT